MLGLDLAVEIIFGSAHLHAFGTAIHGRGRQSAAEEAEHVHDVSDTNITEPASRWNSRKYSTARELSTQICSVSCVVWLTQFPATNHKTRQSKGQHSACKSQGGRRQGSATLNVLLMSQQATQSRVFRKSGEIQTLQTDEIRIATSLLTYNALTLSE
ncbi:hypothetical protein C0Q70_20498 [Pomacea canaliculata]|uniref:Uncharacterized protein n=1 Tax=Pomacea canaliculata TaxID=400727 RepID=A0A2T7NFQ4_POMCA|nr:hypothetical protein C0Q70_20498 [Pomacea canaliculata]